MYNRAAMAYAPTDKRQRRRRRVKLVLSPWIYPVFAGQNTPESPFLYN